MSLRSFSSKAAYETMHSGTDNKLRNKYLGYVLNTLHSLIGHNKWFISGSFANLDVTYNDIDIYFYDKAGLEIAKTNLKESKARLVNASPAARTYSISYLDKDDIQWPYIQLIGLHLGSPDQVFDTMDINKCKKAMLSDGTMYSDRSAIEPFTVNHISNSTFSRIFKYTQRYGISPIPILKGVIDKFIEVNNPVTSYYEKASTGLPVNEFLRMKCSRLVSKEGTIINNYFIEQAKERAPELLI